MRCSFSCFGCETNEMSYILMPCYFPLQAYSVGVLPSGKQDIRFSSALRQRFQAGLSMPDDSLGLPCGRCVGCRLERSRQWALRCVHESKLYEYNCFITLSYSDDYLPKDGSLDESAFSLFMKRFRKKFKGLSSVVSNDGSLDFPIRYFHCGEYGEGLSRPHYHACIFNFDFQDKQFFKFSATGEKLYISDSLSKLWPYGHSWIGSLTYESAAYCARYSLKKINGPSSLKHYDGRKPEYATMSRCPGIGGYWYDEFNSDAFPSDFLVVNGSKCKPPRFYDERLNIEDPDLFNKIKERRRERAKRNLKDSTACRLRDRELVKKAQMKVCNRSFENSC